MNSTDKLEGTARTVRASSTPCIIAIAGLARSGKDTVADFLQEILARDGHNYERYSFATPIKEMLRVGLGLDDKDATAEKFYGCNYRKLAQTLGTEWGRDTIQEDIWINVAAQRLQGKSVIISDIRMENEAAWVRSVGGIVVHLERKGQELISESEHKTEGGIQVKHNDYKIINRGNTLDELKGVCEYVVDDLLEILHHKKVWGLEEDSIPAQQEEEQLGLGIAVIGQPELDDVAGWNLEAYYAKHGKIGDCASQCQRAMPDPTNPLCGKCHTIRKEKLGEDPKPVYPTSTEDICFEDMVRILAKPGTDIVKELTVEDCERIHMVMGISGEAGELLDAVKKTVIYRKPLDLQNVIEEMGDIEFYLQGLRQSLGLNRGEILAANVEKLRKRYAGFNYTNQAAIERADKS